jgi:hypothetical protein
MSTKLDPVSLDPVPARVITPERRTLEISISTVAGTDPVFNIVRETIARDDKGVIIPDYEGYTRTNIRGTYSQLAALAPEKASIMSDIADTIDLFETRKNAADAIVAAQAAAAAAAQAARLAALGVK